MFPEEGADPHPYAHDSRPPLSISSSTSAENASHHHHHHQQQQSSINRWPPLAQYSAPDMAARAERLLLEGLPRHQYVQAATSTARVKDEAQLLLHQPGAAACGSSPQLINNMLGESLLPLSMQPAEQLYNEQLLRSYNKGGQFNPPDPRMYESIHPNPELQFSTQSSNSVFSRTLENLGRAAGGGNTNESVPGAAAAAVRYEEACTPRPRWCPTQEQIQILESLFNSGTTTPSRDMIVDIAAQLRKYGTIAEANVFYWFQNRKARAKRKLQPHPLPSHGAAPAASSNNEERSSSDHHTEGGSSGSSAATAVAGETQSKTRRVSLKPGAASSPISSTSPSLMTELGSTASARLPQQPCKPLLNPPLQESLLVPNRIANNPPHQDNQGAFFWSHQQLGRMEEAAGEAGTGSLHSFPAHMGSSFFRRPSPGQHGNLQLIDPRISLSLAPPAQHHHQPPQSGRGQPAVLNYVTSSDHQILQATSKGILLIDPRDSLEENSVLDASCSSSVNPGFFSNVGNSRPLSMSGVECNQLRDQFPQSSLPLARTGDYQLATRIAVPSLPDGEDNLQLWEELDPCGNLGWGGHSSQH